MNYIASNKEKFMENFYLKSKRSIAKPKNSGPAAYIFPGDDPRPGQAARLLNLLQRQGVEVHKANKAFTIKGTEYHKDSYIIRMDQPYSRMADMMLDRQYYNSNDNRPYDDVGWTLGPLYNVKTIRIEDTKILSFPMDLMKEIKETGGTKNLERGATKAFLINHNADNPLATFVFKHSKLKMHAAAESFKIGEKSFNAGTFIIKRNENSGNLKRLLDEAGKKYGFTAYAVTSIPKVNLLEIAVPRVALVHTWQNTQTEGWVRIALDELEIPYDYISVHEIRDNPRLRDKYDVILFGPTRGDAFSLVDGLSGGKPIPWKKTDITPNIGRQASTDDMRGGLKDPDIVQGRPKDMGQKTIEEFQKAQKAPGKAPQRASTPQTRPRTILRFEKDVNKLLISGGLANGEELAGEPAVVDCKLGDGHVVLFSINPMWRHETHGSFFLVLNSMIHYKNLDNKK